MAGRTRAQPRRLTVRKALVRLLVMGILVPGALIWGVGHLSARAAVALLWDGLSRQVGEHAVQRTLRYLESGPTALDYNDALFDLDLVDASDREALLRYLLAGLAANPNATWYSYAGEDGVYLSAYRAPEGGLRLTWREQVEGGARYRDWRVAGDGAWVPEPERVEPYDPRTRRWYRAAREQEGPVWSDPFLFASGPPGFILSRRAEAADGSVRGVWAVEYELSYLSDFLAGLTPGGRGRAYLVTREGAVVGHPRAGTRIGAPDGWVVVAGEGEGEREIADAADHRDPWLRVAWQQMQAAAEGTHDLAFEAGGERVLAAVAAFPRPTGLDWFVLVAAPEDALLGDVKRASMLAALAAITIALLFLGLGLLLAHRRLSTPLKAIAEDLDRMAGLDTEHPPQVTESRLAEVAEMVAARDRMRSGLRSFLTYMPTKLVRQLMASGQEARLGGEERVLTVMFSDVADFTATAEKIGDPQRLVAVLGEYLQAVSSTIRGHDGTVDKYVGDAVMAFWGAPLPQEDHALRACRAAWAAQERLRALRAGWAEAGLPPFHTRIGINTGRVLVGNIGWAERMNYTVMGDAVNLASRLEGLGKIYGLEVALGPDTAAAAADEFVTRPVDFVAVKGRQAPVLVHELVAPHETATEAQRALAAHAREAFAHYRARRFVEAREAFVAAGASREGDVASALLAARCAELLEHPPPEDWSGGVALDRKK